MLNSVSLCKSLDSKPLTSLFDWYYTVLLHLSTAHSLSFLFHFYASSEEITVLNTFLKSISCLVRVHECLIYSHSHRCSVGSKGTASFSVMKWKKAKTQINLAVHSIIGTKYSSNDLSPAKNFNKKQQQLRGPLLLQHCCFIVNCNVE